MTSVWSSIPLVGAALVLGAYLVGVLDATVGSAVAGRRSGVGPLMPLRRAAQLLAQQPSRTEHPDGPIWTLAPAAYIGLAAAAFTLIPLGAQAVVADVRSGIVAWGAAEALAIVAIFMHGWGPNSVFALIGAYRFVALALSYELLSMFVLIGVALPARSLALTDIVSSQEGLWNVLRQPLGLPLFGVVALGVTFWGPLNFADSPDLAGGTQAEASGIQRLLWLVGRGAMLMTFAAMGATAFLGGWLGPWLPGQLWVALKTIALLVVLVAVGHLIGRVRTDRVVTWMWTILLPLAFVDLAIAGLEALP